MYIGEFYVYAANFVNFVVVSRMLFSSLNIKIVPYLFSEKIMTVEQFYTNLTKPLT